jgi:hypothetical protein
MANIEELLQKQKNRIEKIESSPTPRKKIARTGPTRPWQENLPQYQSLKPKEDILEPTKSPGEDPKDKILSQTESSRHLAPVLDAPNSAHPINTIEISAIASLAIAKDPIQATRESKSQTNIIHEESAIAKKTIADLSIATPATESDSTTDNSEKKCTRAEYAIAKNTIADLTNKHHGYTRVDNYVFDVLIPKFESAPAALVYLYLWRRSLGIQKPSVSLSHQIIADAVGLSKRTVQEAVAKLNELNVVRTHRAYETAIPEHFILRPWTTSKEATEVVQHIADPAIENPAIAKNVSPYSSICHSAMAKSATIKRKVLNKERNLSLLDTPTAWIEFTTQLTEKARERADRIFQSLKKQFPQDPLDEIAACPRNLERFGAPDGTPWSQINSPIGLMETSWPQLREFFRKRIAELENSEAARKQVQADRDHIEKQENLDAEFSKRKRKMFFEAFPDDIERQQVVRKYLAGLPFNPEGKIGQGIAIGKWWDEMYDSSKATALGHLEQSQVMEISE